MYNINPGFNEALKTACPVLGEYVKYVECVRKYAALLPIDEAIEEAMKECIHNGVLEDFLRRQRTEVVKMSIYEFDEEREMAIIKADIREMAWEEGLTAGQAAGLAGMNQLILCLTAANREKDIVKAAKNTEYQKKLFKEFHIDIK